MVAVGRGVERGAAYPDHVVNFIASSKQAFNFGGVVHQLCAVSASIGINVRGVEADEQAQRAHNRRRHQDVEAHVHDPDKAPPTCNACPSDPCTE
jgi:hypothetical protein